MNVFSNALNIIFNLLVSPFTNPTGGFPNLQNEIRPVAIIPSNLLKNITMCNSMLFKLGVSEIRMSVVPRGNCWNCCSVKKEKHVRFLFFNKANHANGTFIQPFDEPGAASRSGVDSTLPTEIFIHGFTETSPGDSGYVIKDAYLSRKEDYNVILLNWSELASFPWYTQAQVNVKYVARILSEFLELFNDTGEIPIRNVHLIGFSLGSHIASYAGKNLRRDLRIPRITALDPAFPEFSLTDSTRRLAPTDADYIDVIHTDAGIFGIPIPLGHADFYPNGGKALQPGCQPNYGRFVNFVIACSHVRAWGLYAESVKNFEAFPSTKCKVWNGLRRKCDFTVDAHLGFNNKNTYGSFYLSTKESSPFSKSKEEQIFDPEDNRIR